MLNARGIWRRAHLVRAMILDFELHCTQITRASGGIIQCPQGSNVGGLYRGAQMGAVSAALRCAADTRTGASRQRRGRGFAALSRHDLT